MASPTTSKPKPTRALAVVGPNGRLQACCEMCRSVYEFRKRHSYHKAAPIIPVEIRPLPKRRKRHGK